MSATTEKETSQVQAPESKEDDSNKKTEYSTALLYPSLAVAIIGLALDHLTKFWAIKALKPDWYGVYRPTFEMLELQEKITIIPGCLQFIYAENRGAAFSMLYGKTGLLSVISFVASIGIIWFWLSLPKTEKWGRIALAMLLGGAIGNLIDRYFRGYVVDFIDAYIGESHWPTFNIADSLICVGATILAIRFLKGKI